MSPLDQDLHQITTSLVRMLSLVRESSELAKEALVHADIAAGERCIENDKLVDDLQDRLEHQILSIIARRQPAAKDLRFLGAAHWALVDIERAGDHTVHVARIGIALAAEPPLKKYLDSERILTIISLMIDTTIKALSEANLEAAHEAHAMDTEIDDLYEQIQRELLTYMMENPKTINKAAKLISMSRHLERMGDHIENVNEHIMFWLSGKRI
ncbi:MAG: phosphate signaling complex protein PhoU [Deinococcales bacterium]